jgi:uncharacterized protein
MAGNERLVAWRGPEPDRVDAARVVLAADCLRARGTSCAPDYVLTYRLHTGSGWVTRDLDVHVLGELGERRLALRRDDTGWTAQRWVDGRPEQVPLPALADALDCDLGLCPLTNTMPVLRAGLLRRPTASHRITVAWVEVPELVVHASVQDYGPAAPTDDGALVAFRADGFDTTIEVDADGLVVAYPRIGRRLVG